MALIEERISHTFRLQIAITKWPRLPENPLSTMKHGINKTSPSNTGRACLNKGAAKIWT